MVAPNVEKSGRNVKIRSTISSSSGSELRPRILVFTLRVKGRE